jgi:putative transposase
MNKRKSEEQWMELVRKFNSSGLNVTAWCRDIGISKGSFYPYLNKFKALAAESSKQEWGAITIPKIVETTLISLKVGTITLDIKNGFDKETLRDILSVVTKLC